MITCDCVGMCCLMLRKDGMSDNLPPGQLVPENSPPTFICSLRLKRPRKHMNMTDHFIIQPQQLQLLK